MHLNNLEVHRNVKFSLLPPYFLLSYTVNAAVIRLILIKVFLLLLQIGDLTLTFEA